ncbi:MAG: M3 family oligoendopeptidase [Planctomycetes bacterium]|jgi:oligoendopeptidase F|nr:M3 family oligoendopeptidase [Planctomycetota bacterium]MBT7639918.1 M3 family oligoendopeptidase [Planctomycetota bacterium]
MEKTAFPRQFLNEEFSADSLEAIEAIYTDLLTREIDNPDSLLAWCSEWSEIDSVLAEEGARRFVQHTCFTKDEEIDARYKEWIEKIRPGLKKIMFDMDRKFIASPALDSLPTEKFGSWIKSVRNSVELFREDNIPLQTEESKLDAEYDKVVGAMTVEFDGETRTIPYMGRILQETDRNRRESAFNAIWDRFGQDNDKIQDIFDRQLQLRHQMALNTGLDNYRTLRFRQLERFDYGPEQCMQFHDSIEKVILPLVKERAAKRRESLGVEKLRPWDSSVDPKGRSPLRPLEGGTSLVDGCSQIFGQVHPDLAKMFSLLIDGDLLDLDSRKNKAPGGYQYNFEEIRVPFIFMNAAGKQGDVETLLHEGGHAFHSIESRHHDLIANRGAPIEFCEVASMAMELLGAPHLDVFYKDPAQVTRARIEHLEGVISLFPWVAMIDSFQHWLYTNPGHSRDQRTTNWLAIMDRFGTNEMDWSGLEQIRSSRWMRQSHLFGVPFYYIEYAIAQLGALQVWRNHRKDPEGAIQNYRAGLSLGNTRSLPQLYEGAGIRFDFSQEMLEDLIGMVREEIDSLESSLAKSSG